MAKSTSSAASTSEQTAVATVKDAAVALPDYLKGYSGPTGTDNIDASDVNIPRLKLAQGLTPEVKDKIVNDGDMFHSITKKVLIPLGQQGTIIPVVYVKEFILWRDQNDGGGIFARARRVVINGQVRYRWDKPNQVFEHKVKGAIKVQWKTKEFIDEDGLSSFGSSIPSEPDSVPAATEHFNYIVSMPAFDGELLALSFSRSASKKARDLNAMLKMGTAPIFARQFSLAAMAEKNDAGQDYFNYDLRPAGFLQDQALFQHLQALHLELRDKGVIVDFAQEERQGAGEGGESKDTW